MGAANTVAHDLSIESHTEGVLYRRIIAYDSSTEDEAWSEADAQWHPIKCILDGPTLTYFELDDSLRSENTQIIDEDVKVESEDVQTLELVLRIYDKGTKLTSKWILRAGDIASFTVWSVVLKRAKRPKHNQSSTCQSCHKTFSFLRNPRDCHQCGRVLCRACCHDKAFLPHLGYFDKQVVCGDCAQQPVIKKANAVGEQRRQVRSWLLCDCA